MNLALPLPPPWIAEVISIGDEMTSGARLDTNTQWISRELDALGIRVLYHSTVGDSLAACAACFRLAARRAHLVVATGGLGPTEDDLTRQAIAEAAGTTLEFRPEALEHIEKLFTMRNREMPQANRIQAMFPLGSAIIPNPQGTAPGIDALVSDPMLVAPPPSPTIRPARVFALPGVPAEMQSMFEDTVRPCLIEHIGNPGAIRRAVIKCFGLGESDMEGRLQGMIARRSSPQVGITVSKATISLRIDAQAATAAEADAQVAEVRQRIHQLVGPYIFGEGDAYELQHAVNERLLLGQQSLAVLEIGHAAILSGWLAALESPHTFAGGLSFPTTSAAAAALSGSRETGEADLVQLTTAVKQRLAADWCLAVCPYPSLTPQSGQILPAAPVDFCLLGNRLDQPLLTQQTLGGHPEILQDRIAKAALFMLFDQLSSADRHGH